LNIITNLPEDGSFEVTIKKIKRRRSKLQNRSIHKYFRLMAAALNDSGTTQRELVGKFKKGFELPVTEHMIKDIYRTVAEAMYQVKSTADLSTVDAQEVYKVVDQRFAEITGVSIPWPSDDPPPY